MAENDIPLKVTVDGAGAGKTLGDLRKEITGLTNELLNAEKGTKKYSETALQLGKVKAEFKDIREQVAALDPEKRAAAFQKIGNALAGGFQAATGAAALFGVEAEEVNKALLKVQAATALAQGIQSVTELGKAFQTVGLIIKGAFASNPIGLIVTGLFALGTAAVALYQNFKPASEELRRLNYELERQKKLTAEANRVIDNEIISLEGVRGKEEEVLKLKKQKIENSIKEAKASVAIQEQTLKEALAQDTLIEKLLQYAEIVGLAIPNAAKISKAARIKEQMDALKETKNGLDTLEAQLKSSETAITNFQNDEDKKRTDSQKKELEERRENISKYEQEVLIRVQQVHDAIYAAEQKALEDIQRLRDAADQVELNAIIKNYNDRKKRDELYLAGKISLRNAEIELAQGVVNIGIQLAGKHKALADTLFIVDKALAIAKIVVNTQAEISAISLKYAALPGGVAFAVPEIIAAKLRAGLGIATILATSIAKFATGGGGGGASVGGGVSTPNTGGGGIPSPPQFNPVSTQTNTDQQGNFTGFNNQKTEPIKAYVTEVDLSESQRRINTLRKRAEF